MFRKPKKVMFWAAIATGVIILAYSPTVAADIWLSIWHLFSAFFGHLFGHHHFGVKITH